MNVQSDLLVKTSQCGKLERHESCNYNIQTNLPNSCADVCLRYSLTVKDPCVRHLLRNRYHSEAVIDLFSYESRSIQGNSIICLFRVCINKIPCCI